MNNIADLFSIRNVPSSTSFGDMQNGLRPDQKPLSFPFIDIHIHRTQVWQLGKHFDNEDLLQIRILSF